MGRRSDTVPWHMMCSAHHRAAKTGSKIRLGHSCLHNFGTQKYKTVHFDDFSGVQIMYLAEVNLTPQWDAENVLTENTVWKIWKWKFG